MSRNPRTNCSTCKHATEIREACWRLVGGGGPGLPAMEAAALAREVREWRDKYGVRAGAPPDRLATTSGCPGWQDGAIPPGPGSAGPASME